MISDIDTTVVIVGAGQAGLAVARELLRSGAVPSVELMMIDARQPDGLAWRQRWDSLRLFTPAWFSHLPGMPMPGDPRRYPLAPEVASYLDDYREQLNVQTSWGVRALGVSRTQQGLTLHTSEGTIAAKALIAATGPFALPSYPSFANRVEVEGATLHSDEYRRAAQLPDGPVLVVGSGNTSLQIAHELAATHCVSIARGSPQLRLPQSLLGLELFRWLTISGALAVPARSRLGQRMSRREIVIGPGHSDVASLGVHVLPRAVDASSNRVSFETGPDRAFESVVWATGYRNGFEWLDAGPGGESMLAGHLGPVAGVYRIGAPWMRNRASSLIGGVGKDAAKVAAAVVRQLGEE